MTEAIVYKICTKCKQGKPATPEFFHRSSKAKDGLYPQCKPCRKAYYFTPKGREVSRKSTKKWHKTPKGREYQHAQAERAKQKQPDKFAARQAAKIAAREGKIPRVNTCLCAMCNQSATDYHHWSYEREYRLDVIPLCRSCHRKIHKMGKDQRFNLEMRLRGLRKSA